MSRPLRIVLDVTVADDADPERTGSAVFDLLAAVPEGVLDEIESVDNYDVETDI